MHFLKITAAGISLIMYFSYLALSHCIIIVCLSLTWDFLNRIYTLFSWNANFSKVFKFFSHHGHITVTDTQ